MSSIEKLGELKQRLTITVTAEEVDKVYKNHLIKVTRTAKLPKFRPGKASSVIVEKLYRKFILQEVGSELIQSSLHEAIEEHQLQVASISQIEMNTVLLGQPFQYKVNLEVYPDITLQSLTGETIEQIKVEITDKDIDQMLRKLRKQHAEWKEVKRSAQLGDRVIIDFLGTLNGRPFGQGGSATNFQLELGSRYMIAEFEDSILGMKASESKISNITLPSDYPSKDLAGKVVIFNTTLHKVMTHELPPLNKNFIKRLGMKECDVKNFRQKIKENMEQKVRSLSESKVKIAVLDKLIELNPIAVPESLVEIEIDHLQQITRKKVATQINKKKKTKRIELPRDYYRKQAIKRVALGLLLAAVIKQYKITVDHHQVRARVEKIATFYQNPEKVISWYYSNKAILSEIEFVVLEDQAVARLLSELKVEKQVIPYEAVSAQIQ